MKTPCTKNKDHLRKTEPLKRAIFSSKDKVIDLCTEIISYSSTEKRLAKPRNPVDFFKNKYFQNSWPTSAFE